MSTRTSSSVLTAEFNGFTGVDTRKTHSGKPSTAELCNFCIQSDGSLKKRYGHRFLLALPHNIRAIWRGKLSDELVCFALCGNTVYLVQPDAARYTAVGTCGSSSGEADFFHYRNRLFLVDGTGIYTVSRESVSQAMGYIPLVAKDRHTGIEGEIHQSLNRLNSYARLTFLAEESPSAYLMINRKVEQILSVKRNGITLTTDDYSYFEHLLTIGISDLKAGDRIEILLRYAMTDEEKAHLLSSRSAAVFGGISNSRVFLWGGDRPNVLYASAYVSREDMEQSQSSMEQSDPLYFPERYEFTVGDGQYAVRAVARHFDRLLIFTEGDVWMADTSACGLEDLPTMNINSSATCAVLHGATVLGNDPVSVGKHTILRWTSETDERNECNAYSISAPIASELSDDFFTHAVLFSHRERGELWIHQRSSPEGLVWVYSTETGAWTRLEGIRADRFFAMDGEIGFTYGNRIYCFDPSLSYDLDVYGQAIPICARFRSGILDFGSRERKRLSALSVTADTTPVPPTVRICADGLCDTVFALNLHQRDSRSCEGHTMRRHRLHSGRFHGATVELTHEAKEPLTIHRLSMEAR
ncbi:MAG: hypothetical protein IJY42_06370 [Clostridia bacterium]|nr:hypothetical protein [Clostridia bacterium]